MRLADAVGVRDLLGRRPATLSGGERQRVALARALAARPRALLLDEPLSAVDPEARESLQDLLRRVCRERDLPVLHVTHDRDEAFALADECHVLIGGRLHQQGRPLDVLRRPADAAVARFLGARNVLAARRDPADPSVAVLEAGGRLGVARPLPDGAVTVVIRPEDVRLSAAPAAGVSGGHGHAPHAAGRPRPGGPRRSRAARGPRPGRRAGGRRDRRRPRGRGERATGRRARADRRLTAARPHGATAGSRGLEESSCRDAKGFLILAGLLRAPDSYGHRLRSRMPAGYSGKPPCLPVWKGESARLRAGPPFPAACRSAAAPGDVAARPRFLAHSLVRATRSPGDSACRGRRDATPGGHS